MPQPETLYEHEQLFFNEHATRWIAMSVLMEYAGVDWLDLKHSKPELLKQFDEIVDHKVTEWRKTGDEAVANYGHL
ncbi:hypothetical protein C6P08_02380 [Weissella confusa]|uniref:hypothetical protein n=1 Tax=Weissella confusa TaxID=1583 RepID=UPI001092FEAB|nr:hypothetical protein [Weissella confusa]MBJ7694147.1 hypothetical protein [Weissella confusa]QBZ04104.1 hypothetical protein C6P08_02380 [Weissella confusa]